MEARRSTWPTVIGVVLIILASLGILVNGCGSLFNLTLGPSFMRLMSKVPGQAAAMTAQAGFVERNMMFGLVNGAVLFVLALPLLAAGIGLVKRRGWAPRCACIWAMLRMAYAVPAAFFSLVMTQDMMATVLSQAPPGGRSVPPGLAAFMQSMVVFGAGFGFVLSVAVPAFVLVWFNVGWVKRETQSWRAGPGTPTVA